MIYFAIFLYVAGMTLSADALELSGLKVNRRQKVITAILWPVFAVYLAWP